MWWLTLMVALIGLAGSVLHYKRFTGGRIMRSTFAKYLQLLLMISVVLIPTTSCESKSDNEITSVIYKNIEAANAEDIDGYMATLHPKSPGFDITRTTMVSGFEMYDLDYQVTNINIIEQTDQLARVEFVLTTRKLHGPDFVDNTIVAIAIIKKDGDKWKFYNQEIEKIEYLRE